MTFGFGEGFGFGGAACVVCGLDVAAGFGFAAEDSLALLPTFSPALLTTFSLTLLLTLAPAGVCSTVDGVSFGFGVTTAAGLVATAPFAPLASTTGTTGFAGFFTTRLKAATGV